MLCVLRTTSLASSDIAATLCDALGEITSFLRRTGVTPTGPPLAIYGDWSPNWERMSMRVGIPVAPEDLKLAGDDVHACDTPSGRALMALHHGSYETRRDTYQELFGLMERSGFAKPPLAWEVYRSDPATTPVEDLVTEIYLPVPRVLVAATTPYDRSFMST